MLKISQPTQKIQIWWFLSETWSVFFGPSWSFVSKNMFTPFAPSVKWTEWETQIRMSWALAHSQNVHLVTLLDLTQFEEASKFHLDPVLRKQLLARHQWKATAHLVICDTLFCKRSAYQWCLCQIIFNQLFKYSWAYHHLGILQKICTQMIFYSSQIWHTLFA